MKLHLYMYYTVKTVVKIVHSPLGPTSLARLWLQLCHTCHTHHFLGHSVGKPGLASSPLIFIFHLSLS